MVRKIINYAAKQCSPNPSKVDWVKCKDGAEQASIFNKTNGDRPKMHEV